MLHSISTNDQILLFTLEKPMNATLEVIANRRSVRAYSDQPVTQEEKDVILRAAFRSPTAGNMMLYSIIEVEDQALKDRLAVTCDNQPFIARAPYVLLFLADCQRWFDFYESCDLDAFCKEKGLARRKPQVGDLLLACCDALIAAQTAVIAAESIGIGSCYIGDILENYEIHRELFNLPPYTLPIALLCLGHPTPSQAERKLTPRFDREFIVFKNAYHRLDFAGMERMFQPLSDRYADSEKKRSIKEIGQFFYQRKFGADFAAEMSRSVREMLKNWEE